METVWSRRVGCRTDKCTAIVAPHRVLWCRQRQRLARGRGERRPPRHRRSAPRDDLVLRDSDHAYRMRLAKVS
jgi:hypothetical protein